MKAPSILATFACAALAAFTHPASAAPGDLDLSFNGTGKVTTNFVGNSRDHSSSIVVQSDGKIVVAGQSLNGSNQDFALARYNTDGTLDTTFNGTGKVTTDFFGQEERCCGVALQNDGKIVVVGDANTGTTSDLIVFALARYNTDGTLDTTFGGTGKVTTDIGADYDVAQSVAFQRDGKIVVAGFSYNVGRSTAFTIVRYNANGTLDTNFNGTGKAMIDIGEYADNGHAVAIQPDGKIVVAGSSNNASGSTYHDFALVRCNANGTLDTTFGGTGKVTTDIGSGDDFGKSVAIQRDGRIVVAGHSMHSGSVFAVLRYNSNGSLDTSFGGTGMVTTDISNNDYATSLAIQPDGKMVVGGRSYKEHSGTYYFDIALVRYNSNGSLDTSFGGTGMVTTDIGDSEGWDHSVAFQRDGKIVVAATSYNGTNHDFALVRYEGYPIDTDGDGIPDIYETGTGIYVSPTDTGTDAKNSDSDGDGLSDGAEVLIYNTNPNVGDTDSDGYLDGYEVLTGKLPLDPLDHPALVAEARTAIEFTFPSGLGKTYRIEDSTDLATWTTVETGIAGTGGPIQRFYSTRNVAKRYFRVEEEAP
ncbi:MAG: hypothetical protein NTW21_07195 [Verrucomicrobia bacterium]|nr:hypothetical protein [Verrucomicrobiota bacterium]